MSEDCWDDDINPSNIDAGNLPVVCISLSEDNGSTNFINEDDIGLEKNETLDELNSAARKIQASWRHHQQKKSIRKSSTDTHEFTDEQYLSALIIQNFYRNYITEKKLIAKQENAARLIQHHYRQHLRKSEEEFEADLERAAKIAQESYNQLQSENKSRPQVESKDPSLMIPSPHEEIGVSEHDIQSDAAIVIQKMYRQHLKTQKEKKLMENRNQAALSIQKQYRKYHAKKNNAAIKIQHRYRSYLKNKITNGDPSIEDNSLETSAVIIRTPNAVADDIIKSSDDEYIPEVAAITIQKHYKAHYEKRVSAATFIQHQFRLYKKLQAQKFSESRPLSVCSETLLPNQDSAIEEAKAATLIQRHYRAHLWRLSERSCEDDLPEAKDKPDLYDVVDETAETADLPIQDCSSSPRPGMKLELFTKNTEYDDTDKGGTIIGYETIIDDISSTIDEPSVDLDVLSWHESLSTSPNYKMAHSPKAGASPPKLKEPKIHIKAAKPSFDKQWPESKKSQHIKVKESPRKKQVQASLEMKKEQRKNDKNKRKDKYHLSNLRKQVHHPKSIETAVKKQEISQKRIKKADTPQLRQNRQSNDLSEPELIELRESSEEDSSAIDVLTVEMEETPSEIIEDSSPSKPVTTATISTNQNTVLQPTSNINVHYTRSSHVTGNSTRHSSEPAQDARGARVARRLSDQSSLSSVPQQVTSHNKASLGTLDSYAVQNMLKRNDLLTRQKNDNHSYLQSYLKQMNLIKRPSPMVSTQQPPIKHRQGWTKRTYPGQLPGNLEKIAKYGRNSDPENWKTFVENSLAGLPDKKGAIRGNYYPVIPAYGKMKSDISQDSGDLSEIPWPTDIG